MLVVVVRSGGFAGMDRTWRADIPDDLVLACPWEALPETDENGADRFTYRFSTPNRTVHVSESRLTGPWRALVEAVVRERDERDAP